MKRAYANVPLRARAPSLVTLLLSSLGACTIGIGPDDRPSSARVRVEGSAPDDLRLITSTVFFEQINLETLERYAVLETADTSVLALPFDDTIDISALGSVYVELLYEPTSTAAVRLRVDLDNGESFDRSATLSTNAQLIYYWVWTGPS